MTIRSRGFTRSGIMAVGAALAVACLSAASVLALSSEPRRERKEKRPRYRFQDVATATGLLDVATPTWGSTWIDRNRDGWTDLVLVRHKRKALAYENLSGSFTKMTTRAFDPPPGRWYYDRHSCAWGEADGDGDPDLMCVSGAQKGVGTGPNALLLGAGLRRAGGRFGVRDPLGRGRSVNWLDFDGDDDLDLFIGNQIRNGAPNLTLRNDRGRFTSVDIGLTEERATTDSLWADWDNDTDPDLLVLGQGLRGSSAYENRSGRFVEIQMEGVSGQPWRSGSWGDLDGDGWTDLSLVDDNRAVVMRNREGKMRTAQMKSLQAGRGSVWLDAENDGDLDLFVVQGIAAGADRPNHRDLLLINREGRFVSKRAGISGPTRGDGDAASTADFDRDGRTDILVTNGFGEDHRGRPYLWRNRSISGEWISVRLHGGRFNPLGFGARVEVSSGRRTWTRRVTDGAGSHVQSDASALHFGIADARAVFVRVIWPSGGSDCLEVLAGAVAGIARGTAPCKGVHQGRQAHA